MTTTTTNQPAPVSLQNDWATAFGSLSNINANGRNILLAILIGILGTYTLAALLHSVGWGGVNIFLGIGTMVTIATFGFQPYAIGAFVLGGFGYAIDKTVDIVPGIKAGLEALGRIVNFALMTTGLTFFFYGTWPLGIPFVGYPIILMGLILLTNIMFYEKMKAEGWTWKLGGRYIIFVLIFVLFGHLPIVQRLGAVASSGVEATVSAIEGNGFKSGPAVPPAPPVPVGPMKFQSGITYPADRNFAVLGIIPANGATFAPPIDGGGGCHINIAATDDSLFDIQNIGHVEDPGSKVQVVPLNNRPTEAWIRTICN